ncbi:protoporphyrinogen oxidase [Chromobacterium alkanivorans]|uniref:protoporphyrinogen oxidase n=1 Tax=Chromobacterium alkanivorans TaxID=1071719 RepID=UPI001967429A|nr:protoporphyrinogen oxidase [Chromobacterium alkanivorans]MBN3005531.1 protoporphyrinogen oxidase [Chromobacterium alkanivorans]
MIAVIGAGMSGLACAWQLRRRGLDAVVYEASGRVGGKVLSLDLAPGLMEAGPNTLLVDEGLRQWLLELGLTPLSPAPGPQRRFVLRHGRYCALPDGPAALLAASYFSWDAKWRLLSEPWRRSAPAQAETVAAFFRRRLGDEVLATVVDPFIGGVFAGDPEELLMRECLPALAAAEREAGSLVLGMWRRWRRGELRRKRMCTLAGGLSSLAERLARDLDVRLGCPALGLERAGESWRVLTAEGAQPASAVVLALPAPQAAQLLRACEPEWARACAALPYAPLTVVATVVAEQALRRPLQGFGGLHPVSEQALALGHLMSSRIYPHTAAPGSRLVTSFIGGSRQAALAALPDQALLQRLNLELARLFGLEGEPLSQRIVRWPQALPQGTAAMAALRPLAAAASGRGLHACSNWLDGVSLPDCLAKGRALADRLAEQALHCRRSDI